MSRPLTLPRLLAAGIRAEAPARLAMAAAVAVTVAVLAGALMVGDSVRGSLRDQALARLGPIDAAVASGRFVPADLADRLAEALPDARIAPAVMVAAAASSPNGPASVPGVRVGAIGRTWARVDPGHCVVNGPLARQLSLAVGDTLELSLPRVSALPGRAVLARRSRGDRLTLLRAEVTSIADDGGMLDRFSLQPDQRPQPRAWVNLGDLQRALGQVGRVNLLLLDTGHAQAGPDPNDLAAALQQVWTLADMGLRVESLNPAQVQLVSETTYLAPSIEQAVDAIAAEAGFEPTKALVYMINAATRRDEPERPAQTIHYFVAAGVSGPSAPALEAGQVALNEFAAGQLDARIGDELTVAYYDHDLAGMIVEIRPDRRFTVTEIVAMDHPLIDSALVPEYPGLTDADNIADWSAPEGVEIDLSRITSEDEQYWQDHRAAPKLLLDLATARSLWAEHLGGLTTLAVPAERAGALDQLPRRVAPDSLGVAAINLRGLHLRAAGGTTDFGQLFAGLSMFLIASAVMLTLLLARLEGERRARRFGLMLAAGFTPARLGRLLLGEALLVGVVGSVIGLAMAAGYTGLMIRGLTTWWLPAVGTTALSLHVGPTTLAVGLLGGLASAVGGALWAARRMRKTPVPALLAGEFAMGGGTALGRGRLLGGLVLVAAVVAAAGLSLLGPAGRLGGSAALLTGLIAAITLRLAGPGRRQAALTLGRLARLSAARHRARSALVIALLGCATFLLVLVGAYRKTPTADLRRNDSGTGGYALRVETDIAIPAAPASAEARRLIGFAEPDAAIYDDASFVALPRRAGDDLSCLNITRPTDPTILAAPAAETWQGRFAFAATLDSAGNPWTLLTGPGADGAIPMIADAETAEWILKLSLGDSLTILDDLGREKELRLVGTLDASIFQGELLIGREAFDELFPGRSGFGVILVDCPPARTDALARALRGELGDYAARVEPTRAVLARFWEVANTYLATFGVLGALGLMLGSVALAVVLVRSVLERRAELALLGAIGFTPARRARLLLIENARLVGLGLGCGVLAAVPAAAEAAIRGRMQIGRLGATLAVVAAFALATLALTAWRLGQRFAPADLRPE